MAHKGKRKKLESHKRKNKNETENDVTNFICFVFDNVAGQRDGGGTGTAVDGSEHQI